jgi:signal transduction histidine kinase
LISPLGQSEDSKPFRIFLDLSQCTAETSGFDGSLIVNASTVSTGTQRAGERRVHEVQPFPILDACDYAVEGIFDEAGTFAGEMTVRRAGLEPEKVQLLAPLRNDAKEEPCGIVLVRLYIFDREADAVRQTAKKAGFGTIGLREARKLLDSISGVAIYRESFRIRPYRDGENDWLTLDAKRVQNLTMKIGRNQIAGTIVVEDENTSHLIERSSREGLEENGAYRRLQSLVSNLLSEVVEPRRRQFRVSAGLEGRGETSFQEVYRRVQLGWSKLLVAKIPQPDRAEAEALIAKETDRLTAYLKRLEERQAQLEAKVTLGLIIGEVMHQGNTPLSFLETETARLIRRWPHLDEHSAQAEEDRSEVPRILNGMGSSNQKLRVLFNALGPLSGARRGQPKPYDPSIVLAQTQYLFRGRIEKLGVHFMIIQDRSARKVLGFPDDLATAATNLIDNSLYWLDHHNIPNPSITVSIRDGSELCLIDVADNGTGVPAEFAEQVFDVGFTLKPNGTGLGLSIAKEAAMRSNGDLQLLSSDVGATFRISLPYEAVTADDSREKDEEKEKEKE